MRSMILGMVIVAVVSSAAWAQQDVIVQPGSRVGTLTLGTSMTEAMTAGEALFGRAASQSWDCTTAQDRSSGNQRCTVQFWNALTVGEMSGLMLLGPAGQERLLAVLTGRRSHRTAEGIGPGSRLADATRLYGEPGRDVPATLSPRGPSIPVGSGHSIAMRGGEATFYGGAWWRALGLGVFYRQSTGEISTLVVFRP